jgi:hypothetical protein
MEHGVGLLLYIKLRKKMQLIDRAPRHLFNNVLGVDPLK